MNYTQLMDSAREIFEERGEQYGDMVDTMNRISMLSTLITGKTITAYDVAMIFHAAKLARLHEDRNNADHYVDGTNYLMFAGQFATTKTSTLDALEEDITALAKRIRKTPENVNENTDTDRPVVGVAHAATTPSFRA